MHIPTAIKLHKASKTLELHYGAEQYHLSAEFLRVHSPSAEVQGHGNPILQYGKLNVGFKGAEPAGQYALKLRPARACPRTGCGPSATCPPSSSDPEGL